MWQLFSYEIATAAPDGTWLSEVEDDGLFSRNPESSARALLEQWINSHHGRLPGGRVFTYRRNLLTDPKDLVASVRVRVWLGDRTGTPLAAAYLGHSVSDVPHPLRRRLLPRPRLFSHPNDHPSYEDPGDDIDLVDDDGTGTKPEWAALA